jgi:hypothetical protein
MGNLSRATYAELRADPRLAQFFDRGEVNPFGEFNLNDAKLAIKAHIKNGEIYEQMVREKMPHLKISDNVIDLVIKEGEALFPEKLEPRRTIQALTQLVVDKAIKQQNAADQSPKDTVLELTENDVKEFYNRKRENFARAFLHDDKDDKDDKGPKDPPPAATGDLSGSPEGAPQGSEGSSARIAAVPAINVPGAAQAADALGSAVERAWAHVRDFVTAKPAQVQVATPEGHTYSVMVSSDGSSSDFSTRSAKTGLASSVKEAIVSGAGGYIRTVGSGLIAGAGILAVFDKLEASGKKVPKWAEPATFIGTGTVQSIVMGGLNVKSLVLFPAGIPAAMTTGLGTHVMGKILGLDNKSNRWFSMIGGTLLMPAAMSAEVGGVSAMSSIESALATRSLIHAAPRILAASGRGGLHGLALGASLIVGAAIGHYVVDQIPNVIAKKALKKQGDFTYSGMIAGAAYAINKKIGDPTGKAMRWLGII